jgi:hypothetical protein
MREVLSEAIALGGSSISDYVDSDGEEGFFQLQHRVYGREGEPCLVCGTASGALSSPAAAVIIVQSVKNSPSRWIYASVLAKHLAFLRGPS